MILGLIPARRGSRGVPGKNTRLLCGKPLVRWTFECAQAVPDLGRIVTSTDDDHVAALAYGMGIEVIHRPVQLARDDTPMSAVVAHALETYSDAEIVVLLQPTSPLRTPAIVMRAIARLRSSDEPDSVVSVVPLPAAHSPEWVLRIKGDHLQIPEGIPTRRQDLEVGFIRDGTVYAFRVEAFRRTGSIYGEKCEPLVMEPSGSVSIDTEADWSEAQRKMEARLALVA